MTAGTDCAILMKRYWRYSTGKFGANPAVQRGIAAGVARITADQTVDTMVHTAPGIVSDAREGKKIMEVGLNALNNTISDHLTEGDFSGTLRDLQGNPVPNGKGGYFDHLGEMKDSYKSLQKIKKALEGSLRNPNLSDADRALLQEGLDKANSYIIRVEKLFESYGGIN